MDNRIRRNEVRIVGLPRCDFVFSSTRICFIAYGFENSPLEVSVLRRLLEERGIQAEEAGGSIAPGQNVFCAKICSKIITAQFCIVLINNDEIESREIPNANVNMEYGLMLGFNKYVLPFQRSSQRLPFNVAGLDTIKYNDRDFERQAAQAIDQAIAATRQDTPPPLNPDQVLEAFLLRRRALITPITTEGDRNIFQMGSPLGFNLLNDFSGLNYIFFGNFTALRPEVALWRLRMLNEILEGRRASFTVRIQAGMVTSEQVRVLEELLGHLQIWVVLSNDDDKTAVQGELQALPLRYRSEVYSLADVHSELANLGDYRA